MQTKSLAEGVPSQPRVKACHTCGLIHRLPEVGLRESARCIRCSSVVWRPGGGRRHALRTAAAAAGALALYFPAVLLPIISIERLGHRHESSILLGTLELLAHGEWFVGLVVLLFSLVFPLVKLVALLDLSLMGVLERRHRAFTYRVMEHAGRWSMLDVLLLAFLVMLVKLGDLVSFQFGPGVVAFTLCVVLSMVASLSFDAHAIWEDAG